LADISQICSKLSATTTSAAMATATMTLTTPTIASSATAATTHRVANSKSLIQFPNEVRFASSS